MKNDFKICMVTNIGAHYRFPIYQLMDKNLLCTFYLGDHIKDSIKTFDYNSLNGYRGTLRNRYFHNIYWQGNSVSLINKPYSHYILDGEPLCLSSWIILLLAKLKGKKTIAWTHGWYGRESFIKKIVKKLFFSLFSKLLIYNEYAIHLMEKEGINSDKMICIANSLDSDREKSIREKLTKTKIYSSHFHNDYPVLLYCGRIQKRKKLEMLIDSMAMLEEDGFYSNIVFVGEDVDGVNLSDYASYGKMGNRVWMYGPCYDDEVLGELFYNASVCVSPGNIGLTAIHSLTFGCPVISHGNFPYQMPEFEAIRPGVTGDFFEQGNIRDLVNKIKKWISLNDEEREKARKAAFEEVDRKWNIHYQINVLKKVIND